MQHLFVLWAAALTAMLSATCPADTPGQAAELLSVLLEWPAQEGPLASPEADAERAGRLATIARGVARVVRRRPLRVSKTSLAGPAGTTWRVRRAREIALVVLTAGESGAWDVRIHAGQPHPKWPQDHGRARCLAQLHESKLLPHDDWLATGGVDLESTERCLDMALRLLEGHMARCGVGYDQAGMAVAYAGYARGNGCEPYGESIARARRWAVVMQTGHAPQN